MVQVQQRLYLKGQIVSHTQELVCHSSDLLDSSGLAAVASQIVHYRFRRIQPNSMERKKGDPDVQQQATSIFDLTEQLRQCLPHATRYL